jgi:transmembrane sensor
MMNADEPNHALAQRIAYLLAGYIRDTLTEQEHAELDDWVNENIGNQRMFERYTDPKNIDEWLKWKEQLPAAETLDRLKGRLSFTVPQKKTGMRNIWPYIAAASVLLVLLIGFDWIRKSNTTANKNLVQATTKDLEPGGNHAILVLANGTSVLLDTIQTGDLAIQGNTRILKKDTGLISYQSMNPGVQPGKMEYNTLSAPMGGQYRVQLADGSRVLLNAGSSLKYPTVFTGKTRAVELTGEAWFEVAKDPMFPFEVKVNETIVQVLGTHFNVNAYANDPLLKITLEEGSVQVNRQLVLKPGQQAQVNAAGNVQAVAADLETELGWKNGLFVFKHARIETIMRQLARWYDCEVIYKDTISEQFNASITRNTPVSKLLHYLEGTGAVHFTIDNKKITVLK